MILRLLDTYFTSYLQKLFLQHYLASVCEILPTFAAACHFQYGKGARLYLELMDMKLLTGSTLGELFTVHKLHTVRYNKCLWSGLWTDIAIEQTLMRAIKSRGGLVGGRLRNQCP